jgi:pilus assembly protein CpaF
MEGQVVTLQDIFTFQQEGVDTNGRILGELRSTGIRPSFAERFATAGIEVPPSLYNTFRW